MTGRCRGDVPGGGRAAPRPARAAADQLLEGGEIRAAFHEARAAWPGVDVAFETFADRLARARTALHPGDLYLACACGEGDAVAIAELERRFISRTRDVIARVDPSYDFVAEVQQILRERMLVGATPRIRDYRGAGSLAGWVHTAALRTALDLRRSTRRKDRQARSIEPGEPLESWLDPETELLRRRYAPVVNRSLRHALALLDPRTRSLLSAHYVEGVTLARIAARERVGIATVFRRLGAAAQEVLDRVRTDLSARLQLSSQGVDSLIHVVRCDLDLGAGQGLADESAVDRG